MEQMNPGLGPREKKRKKSPTNGVPSLSIPDCQVDQDRKVFLVPVFGYENYKAVEKFAKFLDKESGALANGGYRNQRQNLIEMHNATTDSIGIVLNDD